VPIETLDVLTGLLHRHCRTHDIPVAPAGRVGLHSGDARPALVPRQRSRGGFGRGLLPVAGHGLPVSARGIDVLAPQAPELHEALTRVQEDGLPSLNLGGTVITTDRPAERGDNGKHRWYSGQHKRFGEVQETR
jgi:hypothetical protein